MAFFKKIFGGKEPEKRKDFRSKRGGRRETAVPEIPLEEEKRAPPGAKPPAARAGAPPARPRTPAAQLRRPATARVTPGAPAPSTRRTVRIAGRGTPIGQILLEAGRITTEQLTRALQIQEKKRGLLGQILRQMKACKEIDIANALGRQFRVTSVDLQGVGFKRHTLALVPKEECLSCRLIPIEQLGPMLCLAMANVLNRKAIQAIEERTKLKVKPFRCPWPQIQKAVQGIYTAEIEAAARSDEALEKAAQAAQAVAEEQKKAVEEEAAAVEERARKVEKEARRKAEEEARKKQLERYAKKASALYQIADAALASGAFDDAKKRLEEAIRLVPDYAEAKKLLQKVEEGFAKREAEEEERQKAEDEKRQRLNELFETAEKARGEGKFSEAREALKKVFELEPGHARAAAIIASIEEEEEARARDEERRARVEALIKEAREAKDRGELEAAKSKLSEALQLDPENEAVKGELNSVTEALAALAAEEARKKAEEERRARIASAVAAARELRSQGELEEAKVKLEDALASDPENEEATSLLVAVQEEIRAREAEAEARRRIGTLVEEARGAVSSDPEKAQRIVEEILSLDPENAEAASLKEDVGARLRLLEELRAKEEDLRREIERLMAKVQDARSSDRLDEAAEKLRGIMALDPENLDAMALLAAVEDEIREREEVAQLAEEDREKREEERKKEEEEKRAKLEGLCAEARTFFDAGELEAAREKLGDALALEPLHTEARGLFSKVEEELARRREEEERLATLRSLLEEARGLKEKGELEAASLKAKEVLRADAEHAEATALREEIEDEMRRHIQEKARRKAEDERRKKVVALLAGAKEARVLDEMEEARAKVMEALAIAPDDADADSFLSSLEAEIREREEAEARKKAEKERRAKAEELLAEARQELDSDLGAAHLCVRDALELVPELRGARALLSEIGAKIEERKVARLSPAERAAREILALESSLPRFRDQILRAVREKGFVVETPESAFERLPVAEIHARSRAEYVSMAEAVAAAEAALVGQPVEEIAIGGEEAELEPPPRSTPPMPAVERALEGLPEVPSIEVAGVVQAVSLSEREFSRLSAELEPDPVQAWCETYATAGPVIAAPYEE